MKVNITICEHCGAESENLFEVTNRYGRTVHWCEDCVDEHAYRCEHCGEYCEETFTVTTRVSWYGNTREEWCESCVDSDASECECCNDLFSEDCIRNETLYNGVEVTVCPDCMESEYRWCDDCGCLVPEDDVEYDDYDNRYCPNCIGRHERSENLESYHHTRGMKFFFGDRSFKYAYDLNRDERKKLFLGVELETDYNDDRNELADDLMRAFTNEEIECKEDGSLNDNGVEIVSQPMEPLFHLESGMWERITSIVECHDGRSHDAGSCGLHIHISRDYFKNHDAVYRLDRIFHRFESQLVRFSRRRDYDLHWCRISDDTDLAEIKDIVERKQKWRDKKSYAGRYEAVNDTNSATVEIRLWRGTLNDETLRATIEMTAGLAIIANSMSDEFADALTWSMVKMLVRFALEQNGLPHDDLDAYLNRRGL